ncbi:putative peroxisomal bioproteinsis factor [Hibiscus syriacus]|uniref:Peroxisomal bioproteinsis factor n=1 Tax=Hibiscus syriacus TaxID=106335 RepID=A0A6A3BH24_HIBSY|nr:putative peroxisomal bioproteinsis factor [Hibiscus syriacus]
MDLDRRVRHGRERLAQEVEPAPTAPLSAEKSEQLSVLEEKIKNMLEQVESRGEAGKVDEAEALMRKVEALNAEKTVLTQQPQNDKVLMLAREKKMALCEVCGSFLVANNAAVRTQSHVTGKQHIGYGMVRDFISELKREKEYDSRRSRSHSGDSDKYRDPNKDSDRYRERDLDRERSRERNGRGSRDGERKWRYKNGRDGGRVRHHNRSRSRSPGRHSHRRSSRSPVRLN